MLIPELTRIGDPKKTVDRLMAKLHLLGVDKKSPAAALAAEDAKNWIVTYWVSRAREKLVPSAASKALGLKALLKEINNTLAFCKSTSGQTEKELVINLVLATELLRVRIDELSKSKPRFGRVPNQALEALAPNLLRLCLHHNGKATRDQIREFVAAIFDVGKIWPSPRASARSRLRQIDRLLAPTRKDG